MSWFAMPTPMIEPISVWEELAGMPSAQAPRFQMMAAISRAKIMANPALLSTGSINSTGYRLMMPNATTPLEVGAAQSMDPCDCCRSVPVFVVNCLEERVIAPAARGEARSANHRTNMVNAGLSPTTVM